MTDDSVDYPDDVGNRDVYDALREYFQTLLHPDVIDQVPLQRKRKFRDEDYADRPHYDTVVPNKEAIRRLFVRFDLVDGYDEAEDALKACSFYDIGMTPEAAAYDYTFSEFFRAITDRSPVIGEFNQDTFDDVYQDFVRFHTTGKIPMRSWTYLFGFDMPVSEIDIDTRFTIREMDTVERESIYEKMQDKANQWPIRRGTRWEDPIGSHGGSQGPS